MSNTWNVQEKRMDVDASKYQFNIFGKGGILAYKRGGHGEGELFLKQDKTMQSLSFSFNFKLTFLQNKESKTTDYGLMIITDQPSKCLSTGLDSSKAVKTGESQIVACHVSNENQNCLWHLMPVKDSPPE